MSFWTSCDDGGKEISAKDFNSVDDKFKPSDEALDPDNPSAEGPRDLCYMFHEFDDATSQSLLNIRGDDSVAAVKVQLEDG